MGFLDAVKKRIADFRKAPQTIPQRVAPKVEALTRRLATTKRGNVPLYIGPISDVAIPITATAEGDSIRIVCVDWALANANAKGLQDGVAALVRAEAVATLRGK
jgi:hypothetical protein